jgi:pimeloyl-ACP methyl ester carboxylesterase
MSLRPSLTLPLTALLLSGCLAHQRAPLDPGPGATVLHIGDSDVHYELTGPEGAPAVVLVHGFGSSTKVWGPLAADLSTDHRVLAVDLLGFGGSSRYEGDYRRTRQADVVLTAMEAVGLRHADVVAHSMGSAVALTMASRAPDRVDRIVLMGPWLFEDQVPWALRDARQPGIGELIFGLWFTEHLDQRFRYSFYDADRFVTEGVIDRARDVLRRPGSRAAALATIRGLDLPALEAELGAIRNPVLVVQGEDDRVALPPFARRLANRLPRAELTVLPECGHFAMLELPERARVLVRRWIGAEVSP